MIKLINRREEDEKVYRFTKFVAPAGGFRMRRAGTKPETQSATYPNIEDGTYEGTGSGYAGDIQVSVEVKGGEIAAVTVLEHSESLPDGVGKMPQNIVDNGVDADAISGATSSSEGIRSAVKNALALGSR